MTLIKKYFDIKLFFIAVLSSLLTSLLIANLVTPCKLYPAGYSGISRIISDIAFDYFKVNINYSITYFIMNFASCILCFKYIGRKFTIYSFIQFTLISVFTYYFKPINLSLNIEENLLLFVIFAGILNGIANGLCLRSGFSTGGTDFLSVYVSSKHNKSFWNYAFMINVVILLIAGGLYGIEKCMYSILYQYFSVTMVKQIHNRYTYKTLCIVTKNPDDVSKEITKHVRHGITEIKTKGYYSNSESTMLYMVVNSFQYRDIVKFVYKIDPHAFINVQETYEIEGNFYQKPLD